MSRLSIDEFLSVVKLTPLVAIDLIIENEKNEILVGKRVNHPAKGYWFVPGGRIYKNETFKQALIRTIKSELGLHHFTGQYNILGVYDHLYDTCFYEPDPSVTSTHYLVIGLKISIDSQLIDLESLLEQHSLVEWRTIEELLNDDLVHQNTKNYLEPSINRQNLIQF